jgi:hypothetical protein
VPNENVTLLTVVFALIPVPLRINVADWFRNGLCGPFPAIEPFALVYGPGPIIRFAGPAVCPKVGAQITHRRNPPWYDPSIQPLVTVPPVVAVPLPLIVTDCADSETSDRFVTPAIENCKSLSN